jgi:uncharacterized membrane protein required for colicin V production
MGMGILQKLNFLDIFILILLIRICYISVKTGIAVEFFKLLGVLSTIYIASHYYIIISDFIRQRYLHQIMPLQFVDFLVFSILALLVYGCFIVLRVAFHRFMKAEAAPGLNRYGGLVLGLIRWYFTIGLLVYMLIISSVSYLNDSAKHSYLASRFSVVSAQTYEWMWGNIFSKFLPKERPNSVVNEVMEKFSRK